MQLVDTFTKKTMPENNCKIFSVQPIKIPISLINLEFRSYFLIVSRSPNTYTVRFVARDQAPTPKQSQEGTITINVLKNRFAPTATIQPNPISIGKSGVNTSRLSLLNCAIIVIGMGKLDINMPRLLLHAIYISKSGVSSFRLPLLVQPNYTNTKSSAVHIFDPASSMYR